MWKLGLRGEERDITVSAEEQIRVLTTRTTGESGVGEDVTPQGRGRKGGGHSKGSTGIPENGEGGPGKENEDGDSCLKKMSDATYRSFAQINRKKEIEHHLVIRAQPKRKCKVEIKVGTDEAFDLVPIVGAVSANDQPLKVENNMIGGIELDDNGYHKMKITFIGQNKYALRAVIYED